MLTFTLEMLVNNCVTILSTEHKYLHLNSFSIYCWSNNIALVM
jgi:hypothetical protein